MIEPKSTDVGRKVIYTARGTEKREEGTIASFNDQYVFVRYTSGSTSAATRREDLDWAFPMRRSELENNRLVRR